MCSRPTHIDARTVNDQFSCLGTDATLIYDTTPKPAAERNVDDCNDATVESAPPGCKGALIFSEEESQCGSKCDLNPRLRSSSNENRKKWWTYFDRQAY